MPLRGIQVIYNSLVKRLFIVLALLFSASLPAQAPTTVPIAREPHHHLVLENDYVRVFRVSVPAHDATLLHQHDVPYVYVSLGPADVINAVQGKPEAHIARNESDVPFNNVTIELLKPQGEVQNICVEVVPGVEKQTCSRSVMEKRSGMSNVPQFQTDEISASMARLDRDAEQITMTQYTGTLFVLLGGSGIQTMVKGKPDQTLVVGDVMWLLAGSNATFYNPAHKAWSYLTVGFKGSEALHKY